MNASPDTTSPDLANADQRRLLQTITLLVAAASTLLTPVLYLFSDNPYEAAAGLLSTVLGWAIYVQVRHGNRERTALMLNISVFVVAVSAVLAFGSVRNAANFLFVGVVVGAGILFSRRTLAVIIVSVLVILGLLTLAENHDLLRTPDQHVGIKTWLVQAICLVVVAVLVYRNRLQVETANQRLREELALRQRSERDRDRSLDRFVRIFRSSPSPMLAQSARDGLILDVNPAFERCYGYSREQMMGRIDLMLWADPTQRHAYLQQLNEHRRTDRFAARSLRADGSRFDALVSSELSGDPGDRLVITTVVDVTAENQAMERLRRSEERFAKAFNFSPLNMTITRLSDGAFLEINRATDDLHGPDSQPLLHHTTQEAGVWPDPADRTAFVEALLAKGHVHGYETRMRHRDGHLIDTRIWAERIEIDGEDCILSCAIDVSAEKRREAQLLALTRGMAGPGGKALFQALTLHMAQSIGADMVTVGELRENDRVRTLAVWRDGAAERNFSFDLHPSPCLETMAQPSLNFIGSDLMKRFPDYPQLAREGFQAYVGQSLRDDDGTPIGLLSAFWRHPVELPDDARALVAIFAGRANAELVRLRRDREIRRLNASLEERVRTRTAELQALNAELDAFAYSVSHDLKSPLRAIDGFTQLLQESLGERASAAEQHVLQRVLSATRRMSKLIADLLDLARISQGQIQLNQADLSVMAEEILRREQQRQPERHLKWRVMPNLHARCDLRLVRIALDNLIANAVKYTRDQPEPLIEIGRIETPGRAAQFFIRDNGTGFDMAHADKLFKPFERLHMPSSGFEGTGIGLATVRRIVERHGGRIEGTGHPGQGAEFRFSLAIEPQLLPAPAPHDSLAD